jgi:hypothetical protein
MSITWPILAAVAALSGIISVLGDRILGKESGVWGVLRLLIPVAALATTVSWTENYICSTFLFCLIFATVVLAGRRLLNR